jgi:hypothetical protein
LNSFWHCFVGEKNDYYTLLIVLLLLKGQVGDEINVLMAIYRQQTRLMT